MLAFVGDILVLGDGMWAFRGGISELCGDMLLFGDDIFGLSVFTLGALLLR